MRTRNNARFTLELERAFPGYSDFQIEKAFAIDMRKEDFKSKTNELKIVLTK